MQLILNAHIYVIAFKYSSFFLEIVVAKTFWNQMALTNSFIFSKMSKTFFWKVVDLRFLKIWFQNKRAKLKKTRSKSDIACQNVNAVCKWPRTTVSQFLWHYSSVTLKVTHLFKTTQHFNKNRPKTLFLTASNSRT